MGGVFWEANQFSGVSDDCLGDTSCQKVSTPIKKWVWFGSDNFEPPFSPANRMKEFLISSSMVLVRQSRCVAKVPEQLHTKEWTLIASLNGGRIPAKHRIIRNPEVAVDDEDAWNKIILKAQLETQHYERGFDRFVSKFDPSSPLTATIAIEPGCHFDYETGIFFEQDKRRCVLSETLFGLTPDEALWYTMQSWAKFQPRLNKPRLVPGQLYYPAVYSHVFEKYWDYLNDPLQHPDCSETDHTKNSMHEMASALSSMSLQGWEPLGESEAPEKSSRVYRSHLTGVPNSRRD
jgi:hypothetical protein